MQQTTPYSYRVNAGFRVFLACEDHAALFQARKLHDQVKALCGDGVVIIPKFWNFALLRHKALRDFAVAEAAQAQMIVISLRGQRDFPPHVKSWMERWPIRSQAGQAALVALFDLQDETPAGSFSHLAYLRRIAVSKGLDFFCNDEGRQSVDMVRPAFPAHRSQYGYAGKLHFTASALEFRRAE